MASLKNPLKIIATFAFLATINTSSIAMAESTSQYINDATITTKVKAALLSDSQLKATKVSVQTTQGTVQLSGNVDTKLQEAEAIRVANQVDGVKSVKDIINVRETQND